jgi:hypothetical protein
MGWALFTVIAVIAFLLLLAVVPGTMPSPLGQLVAAALALVVAWLIARPGRTRR